VKEQTRQRIDDLRAKAMRGLELLQRRNDRAAREEIGAISTVLKMLDELEAGTLGDVDDLIEGAAEVLSSGLRIGTVVERPGGKIVNIDVAHRRGKA
jgi:hypothetical protein